MSFLPATRYLAALPLAALFVAACGSDAGTSSNVPVGSGGSAADGAGASGTEAGATNGGQPGGAGAAGSTGTAAGAGASGASPGEDGDTTNYEGPTVGRAKSFSALAYSAITTANISKLSGEIGVSAGAVSKITGFDAPADKKFGTDSLAPNSQRTILAQGDVTALVANIDPRGCNADYTNVPGGLTGDVTLYPGVTCMNSFSADVAINGHVTLDARGDSNAFFIIRSNLTLTVADATEVILTNGAEACGVFWRIKKQVTIGKTVKFYGTVIAGTAITLNTGSTLTGRGLAQTAAVMLDANSITIPTDGLVPAAGVCTHLQ